MNTLIYDTWALELGNMVRIFTWLSESISSAVSENVTTGYAMHLKIWIYYNIDYVVWARELGIRLRIFPCILYNENK